VRGGCAADLGNVSAWAEVRLHVILIQAKDLPCGVSRQEADPSGVALRMTLDFESGLQEPSWN